MKYFSATIEKIKFCLFNKTTSRSFRQGITMEKCKTKAIQGILGFFTHCPVYSGIIQAYSGILKTLSNPGIFKTLVYSEPE